MDDLFGKSSAPFLRLTYVEQDGHIVSRDIAPDISAANIDEFEAWCFLCSERRRFQFDRICEAILIATGEVLSSSGVFRLLFPTSDLPATVLLRGALPLTHFLVAFARYKMGKYKRKQQEAIVLAIQERLLPIQVTSADVLWWITEGLPNASQLNEPIEDLANHLHPADQRIAKRAVLALIGDNQTHVGLSCINLIERLFPGHQSTPA